MENNKKEVQQWFLHIDLDAFFASVEQLDNPSYRGQPVIVGGTKDDKRGVVSTASYEARKFGVHSAMPIFQAVRLCPQGIYVRGRMERYASLSYQIMNIFREFSPDVDQMSIDEAFIDLTGTEQIFGPPEKTAMKVKKRVKELTGLTVSVGLATTKYIAKIASGYSKPDGFYFVKPGTEQDFMLSLPLKKVWGVGPKALERLKKAGINTTKDIYDKPLDLLNFLFGNSMGTFLYNVVRGQEKDTFSKKRKTHSISAENTFSCDITDIYTAETALLELAHGVMFRLLKEEKFSRTVTVKIKYDDFTSVSIQKTLDRNVITLDTFFDTIKVLFEQKYQAGRGIRLLGVGFDKVENSDKPYQQSLFGEKEDKKQAVEKAILNLNKKHPEIKIQKARLLKSLILLFIIFSQFNFLSNNYLFGEENIVSVKGPSSLLNEKKEEPSKGAIFNWDINDKTKVKFDISGQWKADFLGSFNAGFGKNIPFTFAPSMPVFKQDIELNSMFTLNNKWYFEGNFADNFSNNTIAIGYKGDENSYFRSGRLSNRNVTMPNNYSSEYFGFGLSGGNNQAPGISLHWQSPTDKWSSDFLFRYDMTAPKSAVFQGMNQVSKKSYNAEDFLYGHSFIFPDSSVSYLSNIKNVYVENNTGKYKDNFGRTYKKLSKSEYLFSKSEKTLFLSQSAQGQKKDNKIPNILITFINQDDVDKVIKSTGSYNDKSSFAGKIQEKFNQSNKKYNLADFAYNLTLPIENETSLVIQNNTGFSPYLIANTYSCPTSSNNKNENMPQPLLSVVSQSSGQLLKSYMAEILSNNYFKTAEDYFQINELYGKITNINLDNNQHPFVDTNPEIYLNIPSETDISLEINTFTPVNELNIGQKASAGTIQVYKNGSYVPDFIYNKQTGSITFANSVNGTDQIKIYWQEESSDFAQGALSLALGYQMNILDNLHWDISLTGQKPLTFDKEYSTSENIRSSFIALSTGINYKYKDFLIDDKIVAAIKKQNDSDTLLVSKQKDDTPKYYYFDKYDGKETKTDIIFQTQNLLQKNNITVKNYTGIEDKNIKGYKLPLQWSYNKNTTSDEILWASIDISLKGGQDLIKSENLKLKVQLKEPLKQLYDFYIQFGITPSGNTDINNNIQTIKITDLINQNSSQWQIINIHLSDAVRAALTTYYDCRIIAVPKEKITSSINETLYIGPYMPETKSISTSKDENIIVHTNTAIVSKDSYSSQINWTITEENLEDEIITATTYFTPADFSQYKEINIKFAYTNNKSVKINKKSSHPELKIVLDNGLSGIYNKEAINLKINNIENYVSKDINPQYHKIKINLESGKVSIDNNNLPSSSYSVLINNNIVPSRARYEINTTVNSTQIKSGSFYVNDITYNVNEITFGAQNYISASYNKNKILTLNNYPVIENGFIKTNSTQKFTKDNVSVLSNIKGGITLTGINLQSDISLNQDKIVNAGHVIKTSSPILNSLSFNEEYRWNYYDKLLNKNNNFNLNLSPIYIPVSINSSLMAQDSELVRLTSHSSSIKSNFSISDLNIGLSSTLNTNQNINLLKQAILPFDKNNYFTNWYDITKTEFSIGEKNASMRNTSFDNSLNLGIKNIVSPSIKYNLASTYENTTKTTFEHKASLDFNIPINLKDNSINFKLLKSAGDILQTKKGGNYFTDLDNLFNKQNEYTYLYTSIPFYELFDNYYSENIKGTYSTKYELSFNKKITNSFKDLYIPSSASIAVIRDISNKEKFSNIYQIKSVITNTSINNFGRFSSNKIFDWFDQEEIISSITGIIKIPTDNIENISFNITSYLQILFMITQNSTLHTAFDFSIETGNNWSTGGTLVYTRNSKTNLILSILESVWPKISETKFVTTRKDSFNYKIGSANDITRQEYTYNHTVDTNFLTYFTVTTGIGGTFAHLENNGSTLAINYSLGGMVKF